MAGHFRVLSWAEVRPVAEDIFRIWMDNGDLRWAERAWQHIVAHGLANYDTSLERTTVYIRLMAMGSIYLDWCAVAHDERHDDEPIFWMDGSPISAVHLGQLLGPDVHLGNEDPDDDLESAVHALIARNREEVLQALLAGFGGEPGLFVALWSSASSELPDDEDPDGSEWDVLNEDLSDEKMAAYQWIDQGCEFLGPVRSRADFD